MYETKMQPAVAGSSVLSVPGSGMYRVMPNGFQQEVKADQLPAGFYLLEYNDKMGFYFQQIEAPTRPERYYGNLGKNASRFLHAFSQSETNMGVSLVGEKGSGKTLLANEMCLRMVEAGRPVILIQSAFCDSQFATLIAKLGEAVIFIDEFEKVYNDEQVQNALLSLLDGMKCVKKLWIFSMNSEHYVTTYMKNRPGRIRYRVEHHGMEPDAIVEYCQHKLENKDHIKGVVNLASLFRAFNFDMLKALVQEMNMFNEPASLAVKNLNIVHTRDDGSNYTIQITNITRPEIKYDLDHSRSSPMLHDEITVDLVVAGDSEDVDEDECATVDVTKKDLVRMTGNVMVFRVEHESDTLEIKFTAQQANNGFVDYSFID